MAIGSILQKARLGKQLTESQVAEITRMKVQIVQDLENDDFHRIAATIYGKGFIKLYAECVGLDPKPLINDYLNSVESDTRSLIPAGIDNPLPKPILSTVPSADEQPTSEHAEEAEIDPKPEPDPEDLFVYTKNKNTIVDESLKENPHAQPDSIDKPSIIAIAKQSLENTATGMREKIDKSTNHMAEIQWGDAPLKIIGIIIGSVIVLLILTITIKSCTRSQNPEIKDQIDAAQQSLQIPVPPPEPYFD